MLYIDPHDDSWHRVGGEDGPVPHPLAAAHLLLTLEQWRTVRDTWPAELPVGVQLPNTADVEELTDDLPRLAMVALEFPKWVDGRAYSQAHLLRARLGYRGQVRATGEVLVDMLPLLQRTGFDAVQLRPDQKTSSALRALDQITDHYQGDVHQPRPLFARVAA